MNSSNYEILASMLTEFQQEYDNLQKQIDEYILKIKETDNYIQSFFDEENKDFEKLSPRKTEDIHKDEITKAGSEKNVLQQKLNQCYHEQNSLHANIEKLEKIIQDEKEFYCENLSILDIQEEDRQRIARELHDTSLQNLAHLVHKIELSSMFIDQDPVRAKLELAVIEKNLRAVIEEIRNTIFDLRPMSFDDLGLKSAFEQLVEKMKETNSFVIDMDIEDVSCENNIILATIFRVAQECLRNIMKHSEAEKITFSCKNNDHICVIDIKDDGKGFSNEEIECKKDKHFGIAVMKERISLLGGKLTINSKKEEGTHIHMEIPLS